LPSLVLLLLVASATGCVRYQYEIVEPPDVAQPIDKRAFVPLDPLEYDFADLGQRLLVRVGNPTDDLIEMSGGRSYVVGPDGESHAMGAGVIAPHSFIEFALPPSVPVVRTYAYPRYGFGYGFYGRRRGFGYYPFRARTYPRYVYDYDVGRSPLWDWTTGEVRLHLSYVRAPGRPRPADEGAAVPSGARTTTRPSAPEGRVYDDDDDAPPAPRPGPSREADVPMETSPRGPPPDARRFDHEFVFLRRRVQ
jgi:hypothetical protein